MRLTFTKCHGSGNDFPLIDARALGVAAADWPGIARALADRAGPVGGDGILLLAGPRGDAAFGMRMFNSDGSEAETCLNGLRCVARAGLESLGLETATVALKTSIAEVARVADLAPGIPAIRTVAGPASTEPAAVGLRVAAPIIDAQMAPLPSDRVFTAVAMPNPHLVTFVSRIDEAELVALGQWCEARPPLLADRANVSFVEKRRGNLFVRTFERGVGLTDACGSAMAASTYAAALAGRIGWGKTITVFNPGGYVRAAAARDGMVTIEGNATFEWEGEIDVDPAAGTARDLVVSRRHEDEVAAWARLIA